MATKGSYVYVCESCKGKFPFEDIRYGADGRSILCISCRDKISKKGDKPKGYSAVSPAEAIKLICIDCNYRFSVRKGSKLRLRCPYCGKNRLMKDNITAQRIIEEVSQMK